MYVLTYIEGVFVMRKPKYEQWALSFDPCDPRFDAMRAYLLAVQTRGRTSPTRRILAEWALLGFLLTSGHIALGGGALPAPALPDHVLDPEETRALMADIHDVMEDFGFE